MLVLVRNFVRLDAMLANAWMHIVSKIIYPIHTRQFLKLLTNIVFTITHIRLNNNDSLKKTWLFLLTCRQIEQFYLFLKSSECKCECQLCQSAVEKYFQY